MKIKTAYADGQSDQLKITAAELDAPQANEVLVKMVATGICHTDVAGRDGATTPLPVALGHEGAGIVERVGDSVVGLVPGDHVVLSFSYCGHCANCLSGHPGLCTRFNDLNFGGHNYDGSHRLHLPDGQPLSTFFGQSSFSTYTVVDQHGVVKVPKDLDLKMLAPLGCGVQTGAGTVLNYLKPQFGESLVVFGTGTVGLAAMMAAKIAGVDHIVAVDIFDNRLALAHELGATETINSKTTDLATALQAILPAGADYTIDTTGVAPVVKSAVHALKPGGQCVAVGIGGDITFNLMDDLLAEAKSLAGVVEGDAIPQLFIPQLVTYYRQGRFPFDKLIKFFAFDDINAGFAASKDGSVLKPVVTFD
ncbi:NAD(P)-dependent alcohol dehydrogenase [Levilactobacillus spicheri]|uniref:Alcohol dehydrogenase n=2 Tax=Levilactobacillus spicheri TaxID=216463 RepID=A0ABQ0WLK1_9LACO|nr:NAD(P)-dependent alcohol dehydrogenase [Levilactobacillus spicheri]KRL49228.1 Zn-dependent alcohol dehydrogenase [Levilactobacillus spicheri DSM 15429]GEO65654.1 alcohol dehydrogenase [Levilactobacillus spicheri]